MDYNFSKIYDNVILIAKAAENIPQAYVVEKGNDKVKQSAIWWADSLNKGDFTEHEYKNGTFTLAVVAEADASSQGGKLSFWTCKLTAEDSKEFYVGITAESVCELIKSTTFIEGVCQSKVFLGRKNNNVWAVTEEMEMYKQAMQDELKRQSSKTDSTSKYAVGDIVETLTEKSVYLGEIYKWGDWHEGYRSLALVSFSEPRKLYAYGDLCQGTIKGISLLHTKVKRKVTGHMDVCKSTSDSLFEYGYVYKPFYKVFYTDKIEAPVDFEQQMKNAVKSYLTLLYPYDKDRVRVEINGKRVVCLYE